MRSGACATKPSCPVGASSAWWAMSVSPGARTTVDTPSSHCTPPSRNGAGRWDSTTWRRSSGTRSPTPRTRSIGDPAASWASRTSPTPSSRTTSNTSSCSAREAGYRKPDLPTRVLSLLSEECFKRFFRQIWTDLPGASTRDHPAPFPVELAGRLIRMFSFVGDTVLDPFTGTASTQVAAAAFGRDSVGVEVDPVYYEDALARVRNATGGLLKTVEVQRRRGGIAQRPSSRRRLNEAPCLFRRTP